MLSYCSSLPFSKYSKEKCAVMELSEITLVFGAVGVKHVSRDEVTSLKCRALDSSMPVLCLVAFCIN